MGTVVVEGIKALGPGGAEGEIWAHGTQCGTAHMSAENYIRRAFKSLTVHLTIGGVMDGGGLKRSPMHRAIWQLTA